MLVNIKLKTEYVILPVSLIRDIFPSTNAVFIKVYLHILMLATTNQEINFSVVANTLQLLESDVMQAVRYLESKGVLEVSELSQEQQSEKIVVPKVVSKQAESSDELSESEVANAISNDESLSDMVKIAQEVFGRPLSISETKSLFWMYEFLSFKPEVILMLLEYCISKNKTSMSYIERIAIEWHKNGINTIETVSQYLKVEEESERDKSVLKNTFNIRDRGFTTIEENYLDDWMKKYNMSRDMISLAYEYCILRTNKLSFPYMNKIIISWDQKNIHTIDEARNDNENHKNTPAKQDFDLLRQELSGEELERITRENLKKEFGDQI